MKNQTPAEFFKLPILGKLKTKSLIMHDTISNKDHEIPSEEYHIIYIEDKYYVCNQWYDESKKKPQLISKELVESIELLEQK